MSKKLFKDYNGTDSANISIDEAVAEVQREADVRRRLFDRWVAEGRMSAIDARDRLLRLLAALTFLTGKREMPGAAMDIEELEHADA